MSPVNEINITDPEPMSRTYQYRKVMKPLLERKRRARMNRCVEDLKDLLVGVCSPEGEPITKLEKADVLELAVNHLKSLQKHNGLAASALQRNKESFSSGFRHCANEVNKFINDIPGIDISISQRLFHHLSNSCGSAIQYSPTISNNPHGYTQRSQVSSPVSITVPIPKIITPPASPDHNNNVSMNSQLSYPAIPQNQLQNIQLRLQVRNVPQRFMPSPRSSPQQILRTASPEDNKFTQGVFVNRIQAQQSSPVWRPW